MLLIKPAYWQSIFYSNYFETYFEEIRYYLNPLFQYKQGNCHNLVHYASLILKSYDVSHKKVWIYAPCRMDENDKTPIKITDPNKLSLPGFLSWGFHVALLVEHNGIELIFDYFIDEEKPMLIGNWIEKMNAKKFHLDIVNAENYLFYTNQTDKKKNGIFNGQYFEYDEFCRENHWIAKGLAINETAIKFYKNEYYHFEFQTILSDDFRLLVGSVNNFECVLRDRSENKKMTIDFQEKHKNIISKYRIIYEENLEKWIEKVDLFL